MNAYLTANEEGRSDAEARLAAQIDLVRAGLNDALRENAEPNECKNAQDEIGRFLEKRFGRKETSERGGDQNRT